MSRRSPLCDLNVLFTGNELQLVWKTREQFWDICGNDIFGRKKMVSSTKSLKHVFLQTNKKSAKTRGTWAEEGRGGDPGVS